MRSRFSIIRRRWQEEPLASGLALAGLGFLAGAWWRRRPEREREREQEPERRRRPGGWPAAGRPSESEEAQAASWRPEPREPGAERASVLGYQRAAPTPPEVGSQAGLTIGADGAVIRKPDDPPGVPGLPPRLH